VYKLYCWWCTTCCGLGIWGNWIDSKKLGCMEITWEQVIHIILWRNVLPLYQAPMQPLVTAPMGATIPVQYPPPNSYVILSAVVLAICAFLNITSIMFGIPALVLSIQVGVWLAVWSTIGYRNGDTSTLPLLDFLGGTGIVIATKSLQLPWFYYHHLGRWAMGSKLYYFSMKPCNICLYYINVLLNIFIHC